MAISNTPLVFIHGLWIHGSAWKEWEDYFRAKGYQPVSPPWPGDSATVTETRAHPELVANKGLNEIVASYADVIKKLDAKPIIIGHSFGGLITEELLGMGLGQAAIAIDPAPLKGDLPLPFSTLKVAFPVLKNPANKKKSTMLTAEQFEYAFGNALPSDESAELYNKWAIPSPAKPLFEGALANFSPHSPASVNTKNPDRGPLLIISGGMDHIVPNIVSKATLKQYKKASTVNEFYEFPDRGHSLTMDHGWQEVADYCLNWLQKQGL